MLKSRRIKTLILYEVADIVRWYSHAIVFVCADLKSAHAFCATESYAISGFVG
jgi:hypothetical protein